MSPHAIDDDRSGRAQQQGGHDDNGGQDDEDNDPDVQDVLGEHDFHGDLADGIHAASLCNRQERGIHHFVPQEAEGRSLTSCCVLVNVA